MAETALLPRTLIVIDEPFVNVNGHPHSASVWWRFGRELARHCQTATLYVPMKTADSANGVYPVDPGRMTVVGRPYYVRYKDFYRGLPIWWRQLRQQCRQLVDTHDLIIGRMPGPAARWVAAAARRARKPMALFVAGDVVAGSEHAAPRGVLKRALSSIIRGMARRQEEWVARHAVFVGVWDHSMLPRFRALCERVESCQSPNLRADMISQRNDTCGKSPIHLLRVCRLSPVKGVETLLDALALLVKDGRDVLLDVVGGVGIPEYGEELQRRVRALALEQRVVFHGDREFGEGLLDFYRHADIHVVSSTWEGLPRCIAEARAFGLPTVATNVGGIPTVIRDGQDGLLVPANNAAQMAAAIGRIIDNPPLRREIIRAGLDRARQSTAEFHAHRIATLIAACLSAPQSKADHADRAAS